MTPEPFSTNVPLNASIFFVIDLKAGVLEGDVEKAIRVTTEGGTLLAANISWKNVEPANPFDTRRVRLLTLAPQRALKADTNYEVHIASFGTFSPGSAFFPNARSKIGVYSAAFSTGSHPRLSVVHLVSKDGVTLRYVRLKFSELVDQKSVLNTFAFLDRTGAVAGKFVEPHPMYQGQNKPAQSFEFDFNLPPDLKQVFTLKLGALFAPGGAPLEKWTGLRGAPANGGASVALDTTMLWPADGGWMWVPNL